MSDATEQRIEDAKSRLADIERRLRPFMRKPVVRDGVKRGEWRSDTGFIRSNHKPKRSKREI
jgi:hypothetical protein